MHAVSRHMQAGEPVAGKKCSEHWGGVRAETLWASAEAQARNLRIMWGPPHPRPMMARGRSHVENEDDGREDQEEEEEGVYSFWEVMFFVEAAFDHSWSPGRRRRAFIHSEEVSGAESLQRGCTILVVIICSSFELKGAGSRM